MGFRIGFECKAYRLTTGSRAAWPGTGAPSNLDEMTNVRDVTMNVTKTEADVTTRGSNGWKQIVGALKDGSVEFESVYDPDDDHFAALMDSFTSSSSTPVALAFLDGTAATVGTQGLWGDFMVTGMENSQPLEGAAMVKFTVKLTRSDVPPDWVTTA